MYIYIYMHCLGMLPAAFKTGVLAGVKRDSVSHVRSSICPWKVYHNPIHSLQIIKPWLIYQGSSA